jgi:DNA-binding GntR family transcriptional regulator
MSEEPETSNVESGRREHAYRTLKDRLLAGLYGPNQRLVEVELAQELGVSRQTVGLILLRLAHDGLVVAQPNRGATVRSVSIPEALRIMHIREALEGVAAAFAAEYATDDELAELAAIGDKMRSMEDPDALLEYSALCGRLHTLVVEAAREPRLEQMLTSLNHALLRYEYRTMLLADRKQRSVTEHLEIVAALTARDREAAEVCMRRHVSAVRDALAAGAGLLQ